LVRLPQRFLILLQRRIVLLVRNRKLNVRLIQFGARLLRISLLLRQLGAQRRIVDLREHLARPHAVTFIGVLSQNRARLLRRKTRLQIGCDLTVECVVGCKRATHQMRRFHRDRRRFRRRRRAACAEDEQNECRSGTPHVVAPPCVRLPSVFCCGS